MALHKVEIRKMISPIRDGAAIFLGNEDLTFTMFIGQPEAAALIREFQNQRPERPLTHDLFHYVLLGFDVTIKHVIISSINNNTFYATLTMEQKVVDESESWAGKRNEVRIDARPSDSIILALKTGADIFITDEVKSTVRDVSEELKNMALLNFEDPSQALDLDSLQFDDSDADLDDYDESDEAGEGDEFGE